MPRYAVTVKEILEAVVEVEAIDYDAAIIKAEEDFNKEKYSWIIEHSMAFEVEVLENEG